MVTPALIDLNALVFKYLGDAKFYISQREYDAATYCLQGINAALPSDYHISFNTEEYIKLTQHPIVIYCKKCGSKHNRDEIKTWDMLLTNSQQIGNIDKVTKAWTCPECNQVNILSQSKIVRSITKEPYFIKVVPMPPKQKQDLADRVSYHIKYKDWFGKVLNELTRQISQLRWDNHVANDKSGIEEISEELLKTLDEKY